MYIHIYIYIYIYYFDKYIHTGKQAGRQADRQADIHQKEIKYNLPSNFLLHLSPMYIRGKQTLDGVATSTISLSHKPFCQNCLVATV